MRASSAATLALRNAKVRLDQGNLRVALENRVRRATGRPRRLLPIAAPSNRPSSRRLNRLLAGLRGAGDYLEIGLEFGLTFETITATHRVGVEPRPLFDVDHLPAGSDVWVGSSDDFFASLGPSTTFDVVFADGLHEYEQTYRDIINAIRHLRPGGLVLVDDVVPVDEFSALRDPVVARARRAAAGLAGTPWHGDVYIVLAVLRDHHPELRFRVIQGSGNDQAVIWPIRDAPSAAVDNDTLAAYGKLSFADVFACGVPAWCSPGSEERVLADALERSNDVRNAACA